MKSLCIIVAFLQILLLPVSAEKADSGNENLIASYVFNQKINAFQLKKIFYGDKAIAMKELARVNQDFFKEAYKMHKASNPKLNGVVVCIDRKWKHENLKSAFHKAVFDNHRVAKNRIGVTRFLLTSSFHWLHDNTISLKSSRWSLKDTTPIKLTKKGKK